MSWSDAHALLRTRVEGAADLIRAAAQVALPALPFHPPALRTIAATGIGSSGAHAALLAHCLIEHGVPARTVPLGAFVTPPQQRRAEALVVFSQGLSPNARLALTHLHAWAGVVVVTAAARDDPAMPRPERAAMAAVHDAGGVVVPLPGGIEHGTLVRVAGPLAGYALAFRLAAAIVRAAGRRAIHLDLEPALIAERMAATRAVAAVLRDPDPLAGRVAFLASGGYGALAGNLALKIEEGLFAPRPPVWDLLDFAHGPYQEIASQRITLLMLARRGAPLEDELLERLRTMLQPDRHRLVVLPATLPGAQALFEHEALLNELVLDAIARREVDQSYRPERAADQPLYGVAAPAPPPHEHPEPLTPRAAGLTSPELAGLVAGGRRTAVLPLGATEQHGPHLPLATDSLIAAALAERFCGRVAEAVAFPVLPFGCSAEHGAFAGTLSLAPETLQRLLVDMLQSLVPHGFDTAFIFSAHGGNFAALARAVPALAAAAPSLRIIACTDLDAVTAAWQRAAATAGIAADAAGHHAGELETSIALALCPEAVRRDRIEAGLRGVGADAQAIFYPDLRRHAANGVVGDPRSAAATRAAVYLEAWVDLLVAHYRRERARP